MCKQKPIVVSDIYQNSVGSNILTDEQNCLVFTNTDVDSCVDKILKVYNNVDLKLQIGKSGYNFIENNVNWRV
ncbi:MAG: hypothetical protein Homavirus45_2, partial [Homavirus sp.]